MHKTELLRAGRGAALLAAMALTAAVTLADQNNPLDQEAAVLLGLADATVVQLEVDGFPGGPVMTVLPFQGEGVTLNLEPHTLRAPGYQVLVQQGADVNVLTAVEPGVERTLRGTIIEMPGSEVAASLMDDGLYARIFLPDGEQLWLEPLWGRLRAATPDTYALYRQDDIMPSGGECEVFEGSFANDVETLEDTQSSSPARTGFSTAELACDADYEYFQDWGSVGAVENRINQVINAVNIQYERDVQITHVITTIIVRSNPNDPYTSTNASTLLNQFTNHWNANQQSIQRDVAELFTGKEIQGSTIGIAWLSGICNSNGYNVVQSDCCGGFGCTTDLSAHELGHNWSAPHCSCPLYTMNPSLGCRNRFNPSSTIPQIKNYAANRNCVDTCDQVDITSQPQDQSICPGATVQISVGVLQAGTATYQWRKNGVDLVDGGGVIGATTNQLILLNADSGDAGDYDVVIGNLADPSCPPVTSDTATLSVGSAPNITSQPQDLTVTEGTTAVFNVAAPDFGNSYQWRKNGVNLTDGAGVVGSTTSQLILLNVDQADEGDYDVIVSDSVNPCSTTSQAATLTVEPATVTCDGDLNGDSRVDFADFSQLSACFGQPCGDLTGDANTDFADFSVLSADFGCGL